jgi:hypothetical protein
MTTRWNPGFFFSITGYLLICAFPAGLPAGTVINELYYDHAGTDTGWEYIELYNNGPGPVDLSTYRLEFIDGSTGNTRLLWEGSPGSVLETGDRILVRGSSVSAAGEPLLGSIENGPDAVRLVSGTGVDDIVGYGATVYCEGNPAPDVSAGFSLSRKPDGYDTDCNSLDFVAAVPTPGQPNFHVRDLELVPCQAPLPCSGESFSVEFLLLNRGLERFTDIVHLSASIGADRCENVIDVDIAPSETRETALDLPFAPAGASLLEAWIESESDENCLNDTVSVLLGSSPGDIVISEIMYRPLSGGSEWLEIESRSAADISLGGWRLSDATGRERLISEDDIHIDPGGYIILAQDSDLFMRYHPICPAAVIEPAGGWPWLNDGEDGDAVTLYDRDGRIVERVGYRDLVGEERGRSIERFSADVCSRFPGGIWHRCVAHGGSTPGAENSIHVPGIPPPGKVEAAPNPFSPLRDNRLKIWGTAAQEEVGLLIRIFDIEGREVSRLYGEEGGARVFSCEWDGRTSGGSESPTGLYICVVEFVTQGGAVCRREKRCIALYR